MALYIAFLRAINVTGRYVKMEDLRQVFEGAGLQHVQTYIQSGNVLFEARETDTPGLESRIETHLLEAFGFEVHTFLRGGSELSGIARAAPFPPAGLVDESTLYVSFLKDIPTAEQQAKLLAYTTEVDQLTIQHREVYWRRKAGLGESKFSGALIERSLGAPATLRNMTTVRKILAKFF